jgi:hypothetical protein
LATLPLQAIDLSLRELDRIATLPGMRGVCIATHVLDKDLSDPSLFPLYERMEALGRDPKALEVSLFFLADELQSADTVKKLSLELGGNAPFLVFDDADLDAAAEGALASKYRNTGQTCVCANRILVQEGVYDAFAQKLKAKVDTLKVGNGLGSDITQGPLIDKAGLEKVEEHVAREGRIDADHRVERIEVDRDLVERVGAVDLVLQPSAGERDLLGQLHDCAAMCSLSGSRRGCA